MAGPVVLISHHKIKEGKLEEYVQLTGEVVGEIKASKPGTLTHLTFTNEGGSEVSHVHLFPDADAFDKHLEGVSDRTNLAYQYIEPRAMELYGTISEGAMQLFEKIAESGVNLTFNPNFHAGYMRFKPG